jgi:hypothetical protein
MFLGWAFCIATFQSDYRSDSHGTVAHTIDIFIVSIFVCVWSRVHRSQPTGLEDMRAFVSGFSKKLGADHICLQKSKMLIGSLNGKVTVSKEFPVLRDLDFSSSSL